jgi:hypothetical protein
LRFGEGEKKPINSRAGHTISLSFYGKLRRKRSLNRVPLGWMVRLA